MTLMYWRLFKEKNKLHIIPDIRTFCKPDSRPDAEYKKAGLSGQPDNRCFSASLVISLIIYAWELSVKMLDDAVVEWCECYALGGCVREGWGLIFSNYLHHFKKK